MNAPQPSQAATLYAQAVNCFGEGRAADGIALLEQALQHDPNSGEIHCHLGTALFQAGDHARAGRHFKMAVRLAPDNPHVQNDSGSFLMGMGRPAEAGKYFRKALDLKPDYAEAAFNLGMSLSRQRLFAEALPLFETAVRLRPRWPEALYNLGAMHQNLALPGQYDTARGYIEQALALNPRSESGWVFLMKSYEGDENMIEKTLLRAEQHLPDSAELAVIRASLLLRQGRKDELARLLSWMSQSLANANPHLLQEMAKSFDAAGDTDEAAHWLAVASDAKRNLYARLMISPTSFFRKIDGYRQSLASYGTWRPSPPLPRGLPCPAFLVGFPRSGTTLLDQILSGHPDVEVAEEAPAIRDAAAIISAAGKKPAWELLATVDDEGIATARAAYFDTMRKAGNALRPGGVFIDKLPLNMVFTPIIKRLFPEAKFILALRHPCDCVFSNYMQPFTPNDAMIHMIDIASAAKLYDRCFTAWEEAVRIMNPAVHTIRYEGIVADLRGEMTKALSFLGLGWHDNLAAFDQTAKTRHIGTPSRSQVTQKLYTTARDRWHKYRKYMGNAPETLRPWIEKFGYEID